MMVLTGNSNNRVKQLYLTNPNSKYTVSLEIMVAVIDDNYSFFLTYIKPNGYFLYRTFYTDIKSHV
jgi:hypothetical protein